jgi:hypothetical protein
LADVGECSLEDLNCCAHLVVVADDQRRLQSDERGLFRVYAAHMPHFSICPTVSSQASSVANSTSIMRPLPRTSTTKIDVAPKFVGQSEAHGGLAHFITPPALSTVVNPLLWVGDCLAWDPVTPEKRSLIHPLVF